MAMAMAAAGTRGELVSGGAGGFALAFKADALWVGTSIDGVDGAAGRLNATAAAGTRFRMGLEGSRAYTLAGRLSLRPSVEVGLRHDGGDAETGAGMDVGGGLVVSDASTGLAVDVRVRMLVMHQAEGFRERGMAVSLSYNPTPSTPLGFVARVPPPPTPDRASSSRHSSCENSLAIKCPRKPWGAGSPCSLIVLDCRFFRSSLIRLTMPPRLR